MCNKDEKKDCKCLAEILTVIEILQENSECNDNCLDTCDRGFLGCSTSSIQCNTRPVVLYNCCTGNPWAFPISKDSTETTTSTVFRIEKIDGCCATFRVLAENTDSNGFPFVTTNSFFTINLNCVGAIRCLQDTFIECI